MSSLRASADAFSAPEPSAAEYRRLVGGGDLCRFRVRVKQTDLLIAARRPLVDEALALVGAYRADLEAYIAAHPGFASALTPLPVDASAPPIVASMAAAAARAGVGPMAAVAGAIAETVGAGLAAHSPEVIVENGGDIYCASRHRRTFLLLAENSDFGALRVAVDGGGAAFGVCTSSGVLGHSLSFGRADAVMVAAPDTAFADAAATALANDIKDVGDLAGCVDSARAMDVLGVVALVGDRIAAWGAVELAA